MKKKPASQSAFFNPRVLIAMLFVAALSGGLFAFRAFSGASANAPGQNQVQKSGLHKVSVSDPQVAETLKSRGARLIADYGSFSMFNVSDSQVNNLPESRSIQKADENNLVFLNAATIDTQTVEAQAMRMLGEWKPGKQMRLIQFAGPVRPEWYQALVATGVQVVTYIPQNTYLVYGNQGNLQAAQSLAADPTIAQWDAEYTATWRIHPTISGANVKGAEPINNRSAAGNEQFTIQMVDDPSENAVTKALIDQRKVEPVISEERIIGYYNVNVALPKDAINQIAERGDVVSIQPWVTPTLNCERQDMIMAGNLTGNLPTPGDYIAYLTSHGFNLGTAANFGVNVSDTGLDNGTTTPFQFLLYTNGDATNPAGSRVLYVTAQGTASPGDLPGCNGHGNLNTSIIGGYVPTGTVGGVNFGAFPHADASGFRWGLGIAPFVKVGLSVIFTTTGSFTNPNIPALESAAYQSGTRISSNSWGAAVGGAYNATAQTYDALVRDAQTGTAGNQEDIIVFSAGNSGSGGQTIGSPGTAKNVITVGAAEGVNAFGGADGCGTTDAQADSANDIVPFSSRGPTTDQRKKPDIMGPGTHISGAAPQNVANPGRTGNGTVLACFNASGVCAGPGGSDFFPLSQQWYTASSGTSHSCPAVAGTAALYRQWFTDHSLTPPSPALTKALLMNGARYMTGVGANDTLPSNNQGMGEANLNNFFDIFATAHIFHDQTAGDLFTATGQQRTIAGTVSSNTKPFRVVLAWTEPPGSTTGNSFINNLDLEVTVGGNTYKGNVFTGAVSSTGGVADIRNNTESVFVPAGVSGSYVIKVTATNIAGDGVPGNGSPLDQDFALVVYNATETAAPVVAAGTQSITAESCNPSNNKVDPGETVTVNFGLSNVGTSNTSNLVATLQATGGVTSPSGPQNYGALVAGGAEVVRPFTFTSGGSCGTPVVATFQLQDGATNLGSVTFTFQNGTTIVTFTENFDSVSAPALPAGWVASNAVNPDGILWITSTSTPDTAPNALFINDPSVVSDKRIDTPGIFISSPIAQVSFRNNYALEPIGGGANFFDGAVLEVSSPNIAGGAFTDITAAAVGGSFASGGYNGTISTSFSNPIGGRQAWSQSSGGYINSVANLGPNVAGQTIKLRFRMCSDSSVTGTGWRVDTIQVSGGSACCGVATPTPGPTGTPTPTPGPGTPTPTPGTPTPTPPPGTPTPTPCAGGVQLSQAFDDITSLVPGGWFMQNNSQPGPGTTGWFQGNSDVFPAQSGAATSYIGTNFNNGTGTSTLSNWLLTPPVTLQNGTVLTFWTRTVPTPAFPDRLQVRMSTNGASVNVGTTATDVGDFTTVLLDINPTYTTSGYPNVWTQFNVVVSGVASPTSGRLAMRYFVENGGPSGVNSDYIGIDTLQVTGSGGCTPTPTPGGGTATPTPTPTPPGGTPTPTPCGSLNENFDGVTAPALPAGWVASNAVNPDGVLWLTSTTTPDSAPNAAFINDPSVVSDKRLDSPGIAITQAGAQVSFRNNYALEPIAGGANFFDGAVLEVSSPNIAGGAFTDITAAAVGGSFVSGGYNGTISTSFSNPIGGRMAWSQSSGGYINTVANLGPNVIGQTIKIRFRMCSDSSVTGTGWRIDNVSVTGGSCGPTPTPCAGCTPTPSPTATPPGTPTPTPGCTPLAQGFDDITTLVPAGWFMQNNSQPGPGTTNWFQGNSDVFPAQGGGATSYIGTNFNNGTGTSTLSNWLLTPPVSLQNGVVLTFWTRTVDAPAFPDRLQVRMSTNGASTNVGTTATSVGDFTTMLLDINPTYTVDGYPNVWTQFTVTLSGIASPTTGRLAMRYFVENGGPSGVNSDFIGIDTLSISGGCGTPAPTPTPTPVSPTPVPTTPPPFTPTPTPGVTPTVTPTPGVTPTPTATPSGITHAQNLSTRLRVETGNNVGIGGFIITGTDPKEVLIRGIGPSLAQFGIPNPLADPKLELNGSGGFITVTNNNWRDNQEQQIIDTGIPPTNDLESAILATLDPGSYTAVLSGNDGGSGAALVEIYDLSPNANSKLANISTRAFVNTGSDVVIGGFILGGGSVSDQIIVRGIGPSLAGAGLSPVLADPRLELRDSDGTLVRSNNDWQDDPSQAAIISGVNLAPTDALESALAETLSPGAYTAVLFGANNGTGLGLVEVYDNPQPGGTPAPTATPCSSCSPTPTPVPTTPPPPTPTETPSPTPGGGGTCTEAFDQVTAPGLPAGWVASNPDPGDGSMFTTVTAPNDTAPNAAFVPDQDNISDKVLDSRPINIQTANSVMTFRNNFNTEFSDGVFWDGGVLEVSTPSISSGDFLDITDSHIGGSITAGGYTGEISGDASNPLSGRMAWSSNSNGWITTTINMGPNLAGQTVTLRFRFGTDEATAAPGWWFDTISISDATCP